MSGPKYYRVDDDGLVHFDFTRAPLGLVPRADGIVKACPVCKVPGEVRTGRRGKNGQLLSGGGRRMIAIHEAVATPIPKKPGEFKIKITASCAWIEEPAPMAHQGLFGTPGDGRYAKGARFG